MNHHCLNCSKEISGKYCSNCGQKTSVHRYSINHFVQHDVVHGVWHVDNGLPYTVQKLFTIPGHAVRQYIEGKRSNLFNFISLLVLILAFSSYLSTYPHVRMSELMAESSKGIMKVMEEFTNKYPKAFMMITIPIYSLISFIWFRKAKLNFTEHLVLNSYKACGELIIGLCFSILTIFYSNVAVLKNIYFFGITPILLIYGIWFYYQFFSIFGYSKKARFWRSIMPYLTLNFVMAIVGIIVGITYGYLKNRV